MWARSLARTGHQTPNLRVPGSNPGGSAHPFKKDEPKSSQKIKNFLLRKTKIKINSILNICEKFFIFRG
jgi:hypothetical protein